MKTAVLVMLRLVGAPSCIGVPGHPDALPGGQAHTALMFIHTVPEFRTPVRKQWREVGKEWPVAHKLFNGLDHDY